MITIFLICILVLLTSIIVLLTSIIILLISIATLLVSIILILTSMLALLTSILALLISFIILLTSNVVLLTSIGALLTSKMVLQVIKMGKMVVFGGFRLNKRVGRMWLGKLGIGDVASLYSNALLTEVLKQYHTSTLKKLTVVLLDYIGECLSFSKKLNTFYVTFLFGQKSNQKRPPSTITSR